MFPDRSKAATIAIEHMHVSRKYGYVYIDVYIDTPKAGCSTIKQTLRNAERNCVDCGPILSQSAFGYSANLLEVHNLSSSPLYRPQTVEAMEAAISSAKHTFAFVRNPFTRVLSAYIDKIASNQERRSNYAPSLGWTETHIVRSPSFLQFLTTLSELPAYEMDQHWRPQYCHLAGVQRFSLVGSFENFSTDLQFILGRIDANLPAFLKVIDEHRTGTAQKLDQFYRNPEVVNLVRKIYADDFTFLKYSLDVEDALKPPFKRTL